MPPRLERIVDDRLRQVRAAAVGGLATLVALVALLISVDGHSWSWPLFMLGAAFIPVCIGGQHFIPLIFCRHLLRRRHLPSTGLTEFFRSMRPHNAWNYATCAGIGLAAAVSSGALGRPWPDLAFAGFAAITGVVVPVMFYPVFSRSLSRGLSADPHGS